MKISSYSASGLATGTSPFMSISIKNMNGTTSIIKKSSSSGKKKQLNYNPREISSAILRASKAQSAGRVAVQAKSKLSSLMKCKGTGQYNESELNIAIAHAKRMVLCAQMKQRNLRREEQDKKQYENEAKAEQRQKKSELKARASRKERDLEQKENIERMQRIQRQKTQKRELQRQKRAHRNAELNKLNEADMEYFRQQLRGLREPCSGGAATGATLDLSAEAMQMAELQMAQRAEQMTEQQIEQQIAAEMGMSGTDLSGTFSAVSTGGDISGGAVAAPVDISV